MLASMAHLWATIRGLSLHERTLSSSITMNLGLQLLIQLITLVLFNLLDLTGVACYQSQSATTVSCKNGCCVLQFGWSINKVRPGSLSCNYSALLCK
jgi:hypothetical protein